MINHSHNALHSGHSNYSSIRQNFIMQQNKKASKLRNFAPDDDGDDSDNVYNDDRDRLDIDEDDDDSSKRDDSIDDQKNDEDSKEDKEQEEDLLDEVFQEEKKSYKDKISEELQNKLKALKSTLKGKNEEEALNIRMHQLAISKILVFTHGKSPLILVIAHTHLGEAYINYKCYEQAIDHLTIALKKNGKLFDIKGKKYDTKTYHSHILTSLGKCYLEINSPKDALELLQKAREIQSSSTTQNELSSTKTLVLMSSCYTKLEDFKSAMKSINDVLDICSTRLGEESNESAMAHIEKSKIHAQENHYREAEETLQKAIGILTKNNYHKPLFVAELYQTLGKYQDKLGDVDAYQISLVKIKTILQEMYSPTDKRVIKIKRQIAIVLLKSEKYKEALNELHETLDLEEKAYGESSIQVAKTLKIIGSIYKTLNELAESQVYMRRVQKIQQSHKAAQAKNKLRYTREIKEKRLTLKSSNAKQRKEVD